MKSVVQHYAYKTLADEEFNPEYVGNELEEEPWRDSTTPASTSTDD